MKYPPPEVQCAKVVFQIQQPPISGVNFWVKLNNEWNWTWHNIWNLLTINLKDKSYSTMLGENLNLQCSDYWKMH